MKVKVTEQGVVIPKELLEGLEEVEICQEDGLLIVKPSLSNQSHLEQRNQSNRSEAKSDPLDEFIGAVSHGSLAQNLDRELYGS